MNDPYGMTVGLLIFVTTDAYFGVDLCDGKLGISLCWLARTNGPSKIIIHKLYKRNGDIQDTPSKTCPYDN